MVRAVLTPFGAARARKGLSLAQLSEAVGYDRGGLSRIERGQYRPRPALALRLAELLEITRDEILFPDEHMARSRKKPVRSAGPQEAR